MAARRQGKQQASSQALRFYLNGTLHQVTDVAPTTTLLNYLREHLGHTGTKEGCAEGDCGACTVVVAEPQQQRIRFRSINSCIRFLPTLDGKAVFTVEGLRAAADRLHPVQQAMLDCHASQCGYCTPGFVMSLFALYKTCYRPGRDAIDAALAGNLCRCTGYRPIISAAESMYDHGEQLPVQERNFISAPCSAQGEDAVTAEERQLLEQLEALEPAADLDLRGRYFAPRTLDSLAALLLRHPAATLLAGGTDVGLWVTKQFRELGVIVYLGKVAELQSVSVSGAGLRIGAGVSLEDGFAVLLEHYPDLADIVRRFASPPIRNAGTLCGNIANGSPIGDSMPALICLGATLVLRRGAETRQVALDGFYLGYQQKDLAEGEFIEALQVPLPDPACYFRSYKIAKRFDQDISAVCAAYALQLRSGQVASVRVCYGGMAATPLRARHCEQALLNQPWQRSTVDAAMAALAEDFRPISDMRASAAYRSRVAANLLLRFYHEINGAEAASTQVLHYAG